LNDEDFINDYQEEIEPIRYFVDDSDRILHPNYEPNLQDILRARQRTTGVNVTTFHREVNKRKYDWELYDIGGQVSERRKWPEIIRKNGVPALLYCVSIGDMEKRVQRDHSRVSTTISREITEERDERSELVPMFDDAVQLYHSLLTQDYANTASVIVFLNKTDLFDEKVKSGKIDMTKFPDFTGKSTPENGRQYFRNLFSKIASDCQKVVTIHETCALDTEQAQMVVDSVTKDVIKSRLKHSGLE